MAQSKINLNDKYNTGLSSDFQKALSETSTQQSDISYWEELLQPAQQTYEQTTKQAELSSGYDITNAYKQYLSQQRGIESSSLLDTSKSAFTDLAKSQYQSSYAQSKSTLASNLASAYEQYTKDYQTAYEQLQKEGDYTRSIYETALDIASGYTKGNRYTKEELESMYAINPSSGRYELTDMGKVILGDVFESVDETTQQNVLAQTLRETDEDLYQYYLENKSRVTEALAGYKNTYDYETARKQARYEQTKERLKARNVEAEKTERIGNSLDYKATIGETTETYENVKRLRSTDVYYNNKLSNAEIQLANNVTEYADSINAKSGDIVKYNNRLFRIERGDNGKIHGVVEVKKKE